MNHVNAISNRLSKRTHRHSLEILARVSEIISIEKDANPAQALNVSPDLWLQTIAGFAKRRSANSVTPASRFNTAANTRLKSVPSNR